jgi:hypothetical protein
VGMSREERKKGPKTCLDWTLLRLSSFKWDKQRGTVEEPGVSNLDEVLSGSEIIPRAHLLNEQDMLAYLLHHIITVYQPVYI